MVEMKMPICALLFAGMSTICSAQSGCVERNIDYALVEIGKPFFRAEKFDQAIKIGAPLDAVREIVGQPLSTKRSRGGSTVLTRACGRREKGETYKCDKLTNVSNGTPGACSREAVRR